MSASEKLRALGGAWADLEIQATRERSHFYVGSMVRQQQALLPLIADVVEAAEKVERAGNMGEQMFGARLAAMYVALTALQEHLEGQQ